MERSAIEHIVSSHPVDSNQELPCWKMINHINLLPSEVFIPSGMIFDPDLPPTVRMTCIRLYTLSRNPHIIPNIHLKELAALLGKSRRTLLRHLSMLQARSYLEWHSDGKGGITLLFKLREDEIPVYDPGIEEAELARNNPSKFPEHRPYFPNRIMGYISYEDE